jgi:hypothetical protein
MAHDPPFELPPELNALAGRNVEQARAAYGLFMDFLTQAMNASSKMPPNTIIPAFRPIQERAIEFANENAERFFVLATELAQAKDIQAVLTLESQYAQNQMQAYAAQAQELGRLMAKVMPTFSRTIAIP